MVRETRHLWVGNLPENVREDKIIEHFKRYGRVESVKVLPKRGSEGGVAAFVDFVDIKSAQKAHNAINKMGDRDLRTDYNEPGTIPSAARGLDDSLSLGSRGRDVTGFTRAAGGAVYGAPTSLHSRDGRYERRLDGASESRERPYEHGTYGHHERPGSSFDRQRHYDSDYYTRERTLSTAGSASSCGGTAAAAGAAGTGAASAGGCAGSGGSGGAAAGGGLACSASSFYRSHSRSPCRFETPEPRYEPRTREPFASPGAVHRDLYREERGRRGDRSYRHSHSRSPHSTHSRNPSPQRLMIQAPHPARSPSGSGSHSRSSSSDSVSSSTSSSSGGSDSSSSSSDESPARLVQSAAVPAPSALPLTSLDKDEPRKSFGIKVQNLPVRSTDTSLKDGLFHEFKKHGKVTSVQIHGASEERYGLVFFRQQEDQEKALGASKGKLFFGMQIDVTAWNGPETESENEFRPLDERIDEFHPKATRTLFIGNLEKTTTYHDLLNIFQRFGEIVDIDIKKVNGAPQYAFLQYCDIASVCKAIKKMDGEYLGNNRLKLGFGKSMPTTCVWLDGLASNTTEQFLTRHFCRYGHVVKVVLDRMKGMALILYNNIEYAQAAVKDTKGWKLSGSKIKVDFANQESQMAFYRSMQASGQDIRDFYDVISERRDDRRSQYEFQTERQYYENARTPGSYSDDLRRKYPTRSREFYTDWDPYQGDYYDSQYFEDPREFREYRADPYEQDIRKYSYLQRERERERERFETDRSRDHGRRTIERSQSPSHISTRRPGSPTESTSISERVPSDSDRRICCRSSERSGSSSSISPPRFEKAEKARSEKHIKTEKLERDQMLEIEQGNLTEKEKRTGRKDRGDKEKAEKQRLKKLKVIMPVVQKSETESELEREVSPECVLKSKINKIPKESSSKGRLDLLPCVVQLTRVKEKEGNLIGHSVQEKQIQCSGMDSLRLASPSADRSPPFRLEPSKLDTSKHGRITRGKNMPSSADVMEKEGKIKSKRYCKSEIGFEGKMSVDINRLAARKRRFEETGRTNRQKSTGEEEYSRLRICKLWNSAQKKHSTEKCAQMLLVTSPKEGLDSISLSLEQSQLREPPEDSTEQTDYPLLQMDGECSKRHSCPGHTKIMDHSCVCLHESIEQKLFVAENGQGKTKCRDIDGDGLFLNIEQTDFIVKQNDWHRLKLNNPDKSIKFVKSPKNDLCDFEKNYTTCEIGKSIQDAAKDDQSCIKRKKYELSDFDMLKVQLEPNLSPSNLNDMCNMPSSIVTNRFSENEEEDAAKISLSVTKKERKSSPLAGDTFSQPELLKKSLNRADRHFQSSDSVIPKLKTTLLRSDDQLMRHWERHMKSDSLRMEMALPSDDSKRESIHKCLSQDLEPGEVQSDSDDDDGKNKFTFSKSSSSLSFILRDGNKRRTDFKLPSSLEKNKFYSFALDKTITPDTKALLERAKTLYSSREDNWSFLPSRFPVSHSCSDKDKAELAPRPIPSWYMKKKKIRTNSCEKLNDKKDELKSQDQERQDLFASRFLHSSIFEQDSRRLQRLERKDLVMETDRVKPCSKTGEAEVHTEFAEANVSQEPMVLFHSRFLELQQHKGKDNSHPDAESDSGVDEIRREAVQKGDFALSDKESELVLKANEKLASPTLPLAVSQHAHSPEDTSVPELKDVLSSPQNHKEFCGKEEKMQTVPEISSSHSLQMDGKMLENVKLNITPELKNSELENNFEIKAELVEPKIKLCYNLVAKPNPVVEDKLSTPSDSLSAFERENAELAFSNCKKVNEKAKVVEEELETGKQEAKHFEEAQKFDVDSDPHKPEQEVEIKPLLNRRQPKGKRAKPPSMFPQPTHGEKPVTRKSERIDKEKLKRTSYPQAEARKNKSESKSTSKSPKHASDSEQNLESSLIHGRTRRRNVRSVYATLQEDEQAGKEVLESPRSMRKRGVEKELVQQDAPVSTAARRGRPPKRGVKRVEDLSPSKGDQKKIVKTDPEGKEISNTAEIVKVSEGWRSPRTQKLQQATLPPTTPVDKKSGKPDKYSGNKLLLEEQMDVTCKDDVELQLQTDSDLFLKISDKLENVTLPAHRNDKNLNDNGELKSAEASLKDMGTSDTRQQTEKRAKIKTPRLKQNTKHVSEDKSHSLKNLEIRVSVDDVKSLLGSDNSEPKTFEVTGVSQTKTVVQENEIVQMTESPNEFKERTLPENKDSLVESEPPADPAAVLLAQQMELEQAVENIAKLTADQPPRPYKEPPAEPPAVLPPATEEPQAEVEEQKRANPASETELAAAIDSITAEEICGDTEGFSSPPPYTTLIPTPDSLISSSSSSNEIMEPETHMVINNILAGGLDDGPLTPSPKGQEPKAADRTIKLESLKKTGKIRAKTPKKSRNRKGTANKKEKTPEKGNLSASSPVKLPESIPEDPETVDSKAAIVIAGAPTATSVVTAVANCRHDATSTISVETPKEAEQPEVEQPVPKESAYHSGTNIISTCKKSLQAAEICIPTLSPALSQPVSQLNAPVVRAAKMPLSLDWPQRSEESRICVAPSCHVTVVTPSSPASTALGNPPANPPLPPDTKASDIDPSSSTLRKILMEPKYVSSSNNTSVPTTTVTSVGSDHLRMSEKVNLPDSVGSRLLHLEERQALQSQPAHHKPSPLKESQLNCGEKKQQPIFSPTTSVISRIPIPYDTEETPRISLSHRTISFTSPKHRFQSNSNENIRCPGMDAVEDCNSRCTIVEPSPYHTGSSPGLRVNTSEGVVVLSYSGQKMEGPQRMRAKISQIPQASAGDTEFQQSVSKCQIKQDPVITLSQLPNQKVSSTGYGHTGVGLPGSSFNTQPVISCIKQENHACDTSEAPFHTSSQGVVKIFPPSVSSSQVLMYNQAVFQQQHGKRGLLTDPHAKKLDMSKPSLQSNLSPVTTPHHSSLSGTRMSPSPGITNERSALVLKQEPQSPRTSGHSPLPFVKACPQSSSPIGTSVVLGHGIPPISAYHSSVHHSHAEQSSVIIQPHNVSQSTAHEVKMNNHTLSGINYGRRGDSMSPHAGPGHSSSTSHSNVVRDMVLQTHPSSQGSVSGNARNSVKEEESLHFNQALSRSSVPQIQSDIMMIPSDHRGLHPVLHMDQYKDMHQHMLMHQKLGEQTAVETRQSRNLEMETKSSSNVSGPSNSSMLGENMELSTKGPLKPLEGKAIHQSPNDNRICGVHVSSPIMLSSHPHGVQVIRSGSDSFPLYRNMRSYPSQFPGHSVANQSITTSQVPPEPGSRTKTSQLHVGGSDTMLVNSHLHSASSSDFSQITQISADKKGPPSVLLGPPSTASPAGLKQRHNANLEHSGHRSTDMVQLLTKYPIVWQGLLALKNDQAAVQLHFVSGNTLLAQRSLPPLEGGSLLRIVQRMRLEVSQLDSVARRMTVCIF
ncbi:Msx2-interacting protein [Oryzias melastigma]|uniref:Msx2-interacting protein n=1 Tax=Oryzias melastigma TaxID=30732 RepID=A0A834F5G0_ORYME|nr:Msx2-interacting protein [Oryzias melastigma]